MNAIFVCRARKPCGLTYAVAVLDPQFHLVERALNCPNHETCKGKLREISRTNIPHHGMKFMKAAELFQASLGVGTPKERKCSPADVKKAIIGAKIVAIEADNASNPDRTIIYSLTLDSGRIVHLAPSTQGATIFKITEKSRAR